MFSELTEVKLLVDISATCRRFNTVEANKILSSLHSNLRVNIIIKAVLHRVTLIHNCRPFQNVLLLIKFHLASLPKLLLQFISSFTSLENCSQDYILQYINTGWVNIKRMLINRNNTYYILQIIPAFYNSSI